MLIWMFATTNLFDIYTKYNYHIFEYPSEGEQSRFRRELDSVLAVSNVTQLVYVLLYIPTFIYLKKWQGFTTKSVWSSQFSYIPRLI